MSDLAAALWDALRELAIYPSFVVRVLPLVGRELRRWREAARAIPDAELRTQALASIEKKKFHCFGGAVLALTDALRLPGLVQAIVALQTISDYLDNLCDRSAVAARLAEGARSGSSGGRVAEGFQTYMLLHEAMMCAVDPDRPRADYYQRYMLERVVGSQAASPAHPTPADGGYLDRLVEASCQTLRDLPGYRVARPLVLDLVRLYSELQSTKHLSPSVRDDLMGQWFMARRTGGSGAKTCPDPSPASGAWLGRDLLWWEFGAATGSTLGMFAVICASGDERLSAAAVKSLVRVYFPAICALHILLDYYIDQEEDSLGGDLNFLARYSSPDDALKALDAFIRWSSSEASVCQPNPHLHRAVVRGLLALYLSDPKVRQGMSRQARSLIRAARGLSGLLRAACSVVRRLFGF